MSIKLKHVLEVLKKIGDVNTTIPMNNRGKLTKFQGQIGTTIDGKNIILGFIYYDWKRSLGVDKINQVYQSTRDAPLDGAFIVAPKFSQSAINFASKINQSSNKRIILMDTEEIASFYNGDELNE